MKLSIHKRLRIGLISILIILIPLISFLILKEISNPGFEEQKNTLYSYNTKSIIDYNVHLKLNNLYDKTTLEKGKLYITEFVDYIDANFKYEFIGERSADIKGEYNIIAKVNGFTGEGDKLINIWEKEFPIKQYKYFNSKEGKTSINEKIKLNLSEYNTFVQQIKESSKISCDTILTLSMNVNLKGATDQGTIEEIISPEIVIPLDVSMFEITENNIVNQDKAIEETIQVQLSVNKKLVIIYGVILLVSLSALIVMIFIVKATPEMDPLEKELKRIFRKHGDRLVAINSEAIESMAIYSDNAIKNSISVNSFEDLVRIADELNKPIFYKYRKNYNEIKNFYFSNENEKYLFSLEYLLTSDENEENDISTDSSEQINAES